MGLNDFILNCERDNKELRKDIEYYKNKNQRLQQENRKYKEVIDKAIEFINREIEIIKIQPSKNKEIDEYVLRRYECLLEALNEVE